MNCNMKKSRRIMALLLVTVMLFTTSIFAAQAATVSDIGGHWANKVISAWIAGGRISGYPDGSFKPDNDITRAEFYALVNKSFKFTETESVSYKDLKETDWCYSVIAKAKKAGYLLENSDGTVAPNAKITREEVAVVVAKVKSLQKDMAAANKFADASKLRAWSKGSVGAVTKAGYMNGYPDGKFEPTKKITRAESVVVLNKALDLIVKIDAIGDQKTRVGDTAKVAVKTTPADATLTVKSSDEKIATAAVKGTDIELKGVATGEATITVTATKDGLSDATATFKLVVENAIVYVSSGSSSTPTPTPTPTPPPANTKPVLRVVEPDGTNDGIITLTVGATFVAPTVTATDDRDSETVINGRIERIGENLVNPSQVGEYLITYKVTDTEGLAADDVIVKVVVNAAPITTKAKGTIQLTTIGVNQIARITVESAAVGVSFRIVGEDKIVAIGQMAQMVATGKTTAEIELLNAAGTVVGRFTIDLTKETFDVAITVVELPARSATGTIQMTTIGVNQVARITVSAADVGVSFRVVGEDKIVTIGQIAQMVATGKTETGIELLNAAGEVVGKFTIDLTKDSFQAAIEEVAAVEKKATGSVLLTTIGVNQVARITVNTADVGTSFREAGKEKVFTFGQTAQIVATGKTKADIELLDAAGAVVGTIEVALTLGDFSVTVK